MFRLKLFLWMALILYGCSSGVSPTTDEGATMDLNGPVDGAQADLSPEPIDSSGSPDPSVILDEATPQDEGVSVDEGLDDIGPPEMDLPPDSDDSGVFVDDIVEPSDEGSDLVLDMGPTGPPPCDPPLQFVETESFASAYGLVALIVEGGSGAYHFEVVDGPDDLLINSETGLVLSGTTIGLDAVIRVGDLNCEGESFHTVHLVEPLEISPKNATVQPNACISFGVSGGSGSHSFEWFANQTGGTVDDAGNYIAGPIPGVDQIVLSDDHTGDYRLMVVEVLESAPMTLDTSIVMMPLGNYFIPQVINGSGSFDFQIDGSSLVFDGQRLIAVESGVSQVTITDTKLGCEGELAPSVDLFVSVAESHRSETVRDWLGGGSVSMVDPGDINGDGFNDAVIGVSGATIGATGSGGVMVYAGNGEGLEHTPVRTFTIEQQYSKLGNSVAAGDFNGDGLVDVAMGGPASGAVVSQAHVYYGVEGGFFTENPRNVLKGPGGWNNSFGMKMVSCDLNGDGYDDLVVSCVGLYDKSKEIPTTGQGGFYVYLGKDDKITDYPSMIRFGQLHNEAGELIEAGRYVGKELDGADLNGDGLCDIVVRTDNFPLETAGDVSAWIVYEGVAAEGDFKGGLTESPTMIFSSTNDVSSGAGFVVLADVYPGDGHELIVSMSHSASSAGGLAVLEYVADTSTEVTPITGIPYISSEDDVWDGPEWTYFHGWGGWGYFGSQGIAFEDFTNDGLKDLVTSNRYYSIFLFEGDEESTLNDGVSYSRGGMSTSWALGSDLDGDAVRDLIGFSSVDETYGGVGSPLWISSSSLSPDSPEEEGAVTTVLGLPAKISGSGFGSSMRVVDDLDGDGYNELIVRSKGKSEYDSGDLGTVLVFRGSATGFELDPVTHVTNYTGLSGWAYAGGSLEKGDFTGDGVDEWSKSANRYNLSGLEPSTLSAACEEKFENASYAAGMALFQGGFDTFPESTEYTPLIRILLGGGDVTFADVNGDGFDDFILSNTQTKVDDVEVGRIRVVYGFEVSEPIAICAADVEFFGAPDLGSNIGGSAFRMGDLNGDGCEDFAGIVKAGPYDHQTRVHVYYGWGESCLYDDLHYTALRQNFFAHTALNALTSGDLDGDGLGDLVVAQKSQSVGGEKYGSLWLIPGSRLISLPVEAHVNGAAPEQIHLFKDPDEPGLFRLNGKSVEGGFGASLAILPGWIGDGRDALIVGSPYATKGGIARAGGAEIFGAKLDGSGFNPKPLVDIAGEGYDPNGGLGGQVLGVIQNGVPTVVISGSKGTPFNNDVEMENGTVYTFTLPPTP